MVQAGDCNYEDKIDVAKKFLKKGKLAKNPAGIVIVDVMKVSIIDKSGKIQSVSRNKKSFVATIIAKKILDELLIDDKNIN